MTIVGTGVDLPSALSFDIVPNPSEGQFQIQTDLKRATVEILDLDGRLMLSQSFEGSGPWIVELPSPVPAVYWVKVTSDSGVGV